MREESFWSAVLLAWFFLAVAAFVGLLLVAYHRWYRREFSDYPPQRKAILPFVL